MKTLTFKVSPEEERMIRKEASKAKTSVSAFLRQKIRGEVSVRIVKSEATGAPAFASSRRADTLTTRAVQDSLADFP